MQFFSTAVSQLGTIVIGLGAGLGVPVFPLRRGIQCQIQCVPADDDPDHHHDHERHRQ